MTDKLSLDRIKYYETLATQPSDSVFMYEVRRMAQELRELRDADEFKNRYPEYNAFLDEVDTDWKNLFLSAQRWHALISSPAIRILGESYVTRNPKEDSGYAHFGMEIWSMHNSRMSGCESTEQGIKTLTAYADIMIKNNAVADTLSISIVDTDKYPLICKYRFHSDCTDMDVTLLEGDAILAEPDPIQKQAMLYSSARERGISRNVDLIVTRGIKVGEPIVPAEKVAILENDLLADMEKDGLKYPDFQLVNVVRGEGDTIDFFVNYHHAVRGTVGCTISLNRPENVFSEEAIRILKWADVIKTNLGIHFDSVDDRIMVEAELKKNWQDIHAIYGEEDVCISVTGLSHVTLDDKMVIFWVNHDTEVENIQNPLPLRVPLSRLPLYFVGEELEALERAGLKWQRK